MEKTNEDTKILSFGFFSFGTWTSSVKFLCKVWLILKQLVMQTSWSLKDFPFIEKNPNFVIFVNRKCLKAISSVKIKIFKTLFLNIYAGLGYFPAGTQRPEDVALWSYFVRDVPDQRIRFLTYFGSAVSNMVLASGNIGKKL